MNEELLEAVKRNDTARVQSLIEAGANVDAADSNGFTPLILASVRGYDAIVELLIRAGASVDTADNGDATPLLVASSKGRSSIVERLIQAGANIDAADSNGTTPLLLASARGYNATVESLIRAGASINIADNIGTTALMLASERGHGSIVEMLIRDGANVNAADSEGNTALGNALSYERVAIAERSRVVDLLIQAGANVNIANNNGTTPLMLASIKGYNAIIEMLIRAGAVNPDPNANIEPGVNPLNPASNFEGALPSVFDVAVHDEVPFAEAHEDADSLIFKVGASYFSFPLTQIRASIDDKSGITYACNRKGHGAPFVTDVDAANPYFLLRGTAIYMIPLRQIKYIIHTPGGRFYELQDTGVHKEFTAGYSSVQRAPGHNQSGRPINIVSTDHCQAGTKRSVYHLRELRLPAAAAAGGGNMSGGRRRTRARRSHQTKRRQRSKQRRRQTRKPVVSL